MTQPEKRPRQADGSEGAPQTSEIMRAVKALRTDKGWSAQRLAEEMTNVGIPWNRHIVVNLEQGRRKSLRVHEAIALAYVLDADSPLDVLVPNLPNTPMYPVTPGTLLVTATVREWFLGKTGPLRDWLNRSLDQRPDLRKTLEDQGLAESVIEQILFMAVAPGRRADEDAPHGPR